MDVKTTDPNILQARVCEDQNGEFGLYIVPDKAEETCITETELSNALMQMSGSQSLDEFADSFAKQLAYKAGQKFAEQENGALANMAEMPEEPANLTPEQRKHFDRGYHDWRDENARESA